MQDSIVKLAPAKLNLALAVGPTAPEVNDPRHPICSWLIGIDLYDELTITRLPLDRFSRYAILWHADAPRQPDIDWPITTDLAVRAHLLLESETGAGMPIQLKLEKRIPIGAGLGGGSSDAAATLLACNELFKLGLSLDYLKNLAAKLGSDVPFFLDAQSSLATGFGETLTSVPPPTDTSFIIIIPEFTCSTPDIYRAFDDLANDARMSQQDLHSRFQITSNQLMESTCGATQQTNGKFNSFNDLTLAAYRIQPAIRTLCAEITELIELPVYMTGSGSALFATCSNQVEAEFMAQAISERIPGVKALPANLHQITAV